MIFFITDSCCCLELSHAHRAPKTTDNKANFVAESTFHLASPAPSEDEAEGAPEGLAEVLVAFAIPIEPVTPPNAAVAASDADDTLLVNLWFYK